MLKEVGFVSRLLSSVLQFLLTTGLDQYSGKEQKRAQSLQQSRVKVLRNRSCKTLYKYSLSRGTD